MKNKILLIISTILISLGLSACSINNLTQSISSQQEVSTKRNDSNINNKTSNLQDNNPTASKVEAKEESDENNQQPTSISANEAISLANKYDPSKNLQSYKENPNPFVTAASSDNTNNNDGSIVVTTKVSDKSNNSLTDYNPSDFYINPNDPDSENKTSKGRTVATVTPIGKEKVHITISTDTSKTGGHGPFFDETVPRY